MSEAANPEKGRRREYSENDALVIALIGGMRAQNHPYEKIHAALAGGEVGDWPRMAAADTQTRQEHETGSQDTNALMTRLTATVAKFEGQLEAVTGERDYLRVQLENEQNARLDAEKRAAAAEAAVDLLKEKPRRWFWQR